MQRQARTVYLGAFEEVIPAAGSPYNLVQRTDLSASVRHVRTRTTGGVITARFEYIHRDHLGSVDVVTSAAAAPGGVRAHRDGRPGHDVGAWRSSTQRAHLSEAERAGLTAQRATREVRGPRSG
ncbi:MAG: hypothetical protein RIB46_16740 [Pseudomonadales bacterium]